MRLRSVLGSLLLIMTGATADCFAQAVGVSGDHYESYTAQLDCTAVNCNLSFPIFSYPSRPTALLLIEDISCQSNSETTVFGAQFGPTGSPGEFTGKKRSVLIQTEFSYNSFTDTYNYAYHSTQKMLMTQNRYMTVNLFVNERAGSVVHAYINCSLSGTLL